MAAYAALVSLTYIIEQIQHHPHPPISLDQKQAQSLTENATFLQDFLEGYSHGSSEEANALERRIADAAYVAEDLIESHTVDQIRVQSGSTLSTHDVKEISSNDLYQGLQKVIEDMELIKNEVMEIKLVLPMRINSISDQGSLRSPSNYGQNIMVGLDGLLNEVMDKLTGQQSNRQIIPIVGMGGIGKTTLARNIYVNPLIKHHFDILAWATISQGYNVREILLEVLVCLKTKGTKESLSGSSEDEIGEKLYKSLSGWRYLIVMDDIWSIEAWNEVKLFFPDNRNGSRIVMTTRLSNVASQIAGSHSHGINMNFLDEDQSWNLLSKIVFGEERCVLELEETGKKISKNCKGLPLSIVVVGGLLAKSKPTQEYWEHIAENLNAIVNSDDNESCLRILYTSYDQLPAHLKTCFLYMGAFPEDDVIRVSTLIKLWVAEGFLKPIRGKSLEVVAEEYLHDLIERNLMLVHKWGKTRKIKSCTIHDLLRDLCLRQAQNEKFIFVSEQHSLDVPQGIDTERRICIHRGTSNAHYLSLDFQSMSLTRSFISQFAAPSMSIRLLRVLQAGDRGLYHKDMHFLESIFQLVNSRYLSIRLDWLSISTYISSIHLLWNLQTLIVHGAWNTTAPSEIWTMSQLRHVEFVMLDLPDPPTGQMDGRDEIVLTNLQTLLRIRNFIVAEEVVKRIPNIKKLQVYYQELESCSCSSLNNLGRLHKLESLDCIFVQEKKPIRSDLVQNLTFPHSLKKLSLQFTELHWEDMSTNIASLPLLQVLKLEVKSFIGSKWETVEGQFLNLRFLLIDKCDDLECWTTYSTHFPRLEHIVLKNMDKLEEIPWGIGDIPTLQSIEIGRCSDSAVISAKEILLEQEDLGNEGLHVKVELWDKNQELESLAAHNFQVSVIQE